MLPVVTQMSTPPEVPFHSNAAATQPTQWPTVIGVIAIIYGALGGIGAVWGLVSLAMPTISSPGVPVDFKVRADVMAISIVDGSIGLLFAAMLAIGGISLMRRHANGVRWLRRYAILRLVLLVPLAIGTGWASAVTVQDMLGAIEQKSKEAAASGAGGNASASPRSKSLDPSAKESSPDAVRAEGSIIVSSGDGRVEVAGGTVESSEGGTTVITGANGSRVVITGSDGTDSEQVITIDGSPAAPASTSNSRAATRAVTEAEMMSAMKPFMPAIAIGSVACYALLASVWPIVLLAVLSSPARKSEVSAWPEGF